MRSSSSRFSPKAGSTSNSPLRKAKVLSEMCTRLGIMKEELLDYLNWQCQLTRPHMHIHTPLRTHTHTHPLIQIYIWKWQQEIITTFWVRVALERERESGREGQRVETSSIMQHLKLHLHLVAQRRRTYPALPLDSILLASSTSLE